MATFIHPTAVIYPNVEIRDNVYIGANCIIGAPAEHKQYWGVDPEHGVLIKEGTIITGAVTIDAGTIQRTIVGRYCFIMKGSYIAHDCVIEDGVTLSAGSKLAGFVSIGERTNLGMGVAVHQRVQVPSGCMIGMNATVTKKSKLFDNGCFVGSPAKFLRWNDYKRVEWEKQ